jgi:hypothetical protein
MKPQYDNFDYEDARSSVMAAFDEEKIEEGFTAEDVEGLANIVHVLRAKGLDAIDVWEHNHVSDYLANLTATYKNKHNV